MVPLEVWFLGGAVAAFGAAVWLVAQRERKGAGVLVSLADQEGWDCRRAAPPGLLSFLTELARVRVKQEPGLYLAGPSPQGPFQMVRTGGPGRGRRRDASSWTFLHIRTAARTRGLWIRPRERFRPDRSSPWRASAGFARRFAVDAEDDDEADRLIGARLSALLMRPQGAVHLGWQDHELVIAFPVGVSSPHGVKTLLRYGSAVASSLTGGHDERVPRPVGQDRPVGQERAVAKETETALS